MFKRLLYSLMIVGLITSIISPNNLAQAKEYQCTITIDANKHDFFNPVYMTSECVKGFAYGYYSEQGFHLMGSNN